MELRYSDADESFRADLRAWLDAGVEFGRVAVNLSPAQFRLEGLSTSILEALARHSVPPQRLCVEVMETVHFGEVVAGTVGRLRAEGVQIALDDFGAGYASLTHLASFAIDRLKIDRSLCQFESELETLRGVVAHAHDLGMQVVAEGVEDADQLAAIRDAGCDLVQGFWVGRPLPPAEVPAYLARPAFSLA